MEEGGERVVEAEGRSVYRIMKGSQKKSSHPCSGACLGQDRFRLALAIPFLWEQSPGTPKHCKTAPRTANCCDTNCSVVHSNANNDTNYNSFHSNVADDDDGSASMVTAEGLTCRASCMYDSCDDERVGGTGGASKRPLAEKSKEEEEACIDFIMRRFLPAAQAMAASESPNYEPAPETYSCRRGHLGDALIKPSPRLCPIPLVIPSVSLHSGRSSSASASTSTALQTDGAGNNDHRIDACPAMPMKLCGLFPPRRIHRILLRFNRLFTLRTFLTHQKKIKVMIMKTKTKTNTSNTKANYMNTKTKMNTKGKTKTTTNTKTKTKTTMTTTKNMIMATAAKKKKKSSTPNAPRSLLDVIDDDDDDDDTDNDLSESDVDEDMMVMRQVQAISQRRRAQTLLMQANSPYFDSPLDQSQSQSQSLNHHTSSRTPSYNSYSYSDDPYNNRLVDCYYDALDRFSRPQTPSSLALTPFRNALRGSPNSPFKNIKGFLGTPKINNYAVIPKANNITNATSNLSESNGSAIISTNSSNHNSLEERYRSIQLRKLVEYRAYSNNEENLGGNDDLAQDSRVWPLEIVSSSKIDSPSTTTSASLPLPLPKSPSDPWLWKTIPYSRANIAYPVSATSASTSPSCSKRMDYDHRIAVSTGGRFLPLVSEKNDKPSTHSTSFEVI